MCDIDISVSIAYHHCLFIHSYQIILYFLRLNSLLFLHSFMVHRINNPNGIMKIIKNNIDITISHQPPYFSNHQNDDLLILRYIQSSSKTYSIAYSFSIQFKMLIIDSEALCHIAIQNYTTLKRICPTS